MPTLSAPSGWTWTPLSDVAQLESGHTPSRRHPEYWDGNIPWIGLKDAIDHHGSVIYDTYQHVTELGLAHSSARLLPKDTVCLSRTASVGYVVVMGRPMATSQDFVNWVCGPKIDPHFLKYVLLAEREAFLRFASGTTHQTIYYPEAKAFHVCLPPMNEQRAIVHILGSLDDQIELNRQMNKTLEAMARAIFKSWFVDFDPVRAKSEGRQPGGMDAETAALFPDGFEEIEGWEVPKGWEVKSLDRIATFLNGLALQNYPAETEKEYLPVIKIAQMHKGNTEGSDKASVNILPEYVIGDGDILFSWSGSLEVVIWCGGKGALNQHIFKVSSELYPKWFYFHWTLQHLPDFQLIAEGKATTMGHIQRQHLSEAITFVPPRELIEGMNRIIGPLLDKIIENNIESRELAQIRDMLLPKLMSGQIKGET